MAINLTDELNAATKKGKIASAKQVYLEGDQENLQQIGDKTHQLEQSIKDISVSGGASTANAVSYNNETSGMTAVNAQAAIDELAAKNKAQDATMVTKADAADVTSKMQTEQTRVNGELAKKFDKSNIAQELGDSEDKVVSQSALPFREIESPEFLKLIVDAEDHVLFGIQLDGSIEWGKGIPSPIRAKLQEIINQSQQDKTDLTDALNAAKEELNAAKEELNLFQKDTKEYFKVNLKKTISILGDSLSTFAGYVPTGNATHYPNSINDVASVEQTWWMKLITDANAKIDINESWAGAQVSGINISSFTSRIEKLGNPNYIIIHGGTNDSRRNVAVGNLHFNSVEEELNINEFSDAYDLMIRKAMRLYPHANIIVIVPNDSKKELADVIINIAKNYNLFACVDLRNYSFNLVNGHYQASDMVTVENAVLKGIFVNKNVLAEEGKSLIDDEVKDCFNVIENEEFIHAITDSEDRLLFGIYRETGKPYFPLNEMYHVEQNEEFFAVWLDAENHVLLGIRRDGVIIGEIHAVNALKEVVSKLQSDLATFQEKIGTIDASLQELLSVFSLQDNPEYLAVETDADNKVLSCTNPDGSHYIHKVKSETIPEEFEHIEDSEGRMEITTDTNGKVIGYRDLEGTRHEHKMSVKHLELTDEAATEVNNAFKSAGIKMVNPSDFSNYEHIELPIPHIAAQVKLYASKLPTTKTDDIEAEIEYNDRDGNYFRKPVILNAQGSSSMNYYVKNMAIDLNDGSEIKFGDFPTQDSFHLKKYYIDAFRGQCIVGYWLTEQVYKTNEIGKQYPYEYLQKFDSIIDSNGSFEKDNFTGAKCHPDGFPIVITWINSNTGEEMEMGVYAWNLKKSKEVYNMNKKKSTNIILDGEIGYSTMFGGTVNWSSFEIRNPKSLIDIDGNKYDGDNPKELSNTDKLSSDVKKYIERLSESYNVISKDKTKENFEKYFLVSPFIDYWLVSSILYNLDGFNKNWIWCTWDGEHFTPTLYDLDSIFGQHTTGTFVIRGSETNLVGRGNPPVNLLIELYKDEIKARYKELRDKGVFSVDKITSLLKTWLGKIGYDNLKNDLTIFNETPSYRNGYLSDKWDVVTYNWGAEKDDYDNEKEYNAGDLCNYDGFKFKALQQVSGEIPVTQKYDKLPYLLGFHNSLQRVSNWLRAKINSLDETYEYNV